jgi:hypothetical protein
MLLSVRLCLGKTPSARRNHHTHNVGNWEVQLRGLSASSERVPSTSGKTVAVN